MIKIVSTISFFCFAVTLNSQTLQWVRSFGGTNSDVGNEITLDGFGNLLTTGTFMDTVDFDPGPGIFNLASAGATDIFISKIDSAGNFKWAKSFRGPNIQRGYSITTDSLNNVYVTGRFRDTVDFDPGLGIFKLIASTVKDDIFICKLNTYGDFIWAVKLGSANDDVGQKIKTDRYGNIYLTGYFYNTVDFDPDTSAVFNLTSAGLTDIFVLKLNLDGNLIWAKKFGGIYDDHGLDLTVDIAGNTYLTGDFLGTVDFDPNAGVSNLSCAGSPPNGSDIFSSKWDSSGTFLWAKRMGGSGQDFGTSIAVDTKGNVYTTGTFTGTAYINSQISLTSAGGWDALISKQDTSGGFVWAYAIGGTGQNDNGNSVVTDNSNNIYLTGSFEGTVDFDPGIVVSNMTAAGFMDIFILKLDSSGNFKWSGLMGGGGADGANSTCIDAADNLYTTGGFESVADFNPNPSAIFNLISHGASEVFVQRLTQNSIATGIAPTANYAFINVFPNPFAEIVSLRSIDFISMIEITNILGERLLSTSISSNGAEIDLSNLPKGIYYLKIWSENGITGRKILKL